MKIQPCIKCGGTNILIADCNYSSFNIAYGKCQNPKCNNKRTYSCGCLVKRDEIIKWWNKDNNPKIQKTILEKEMRQLQKKLDKINKLIVRRTKDNE